MTRRIIALAYGTLCHGLFLVAVSTMFLALAFGMNTGWGQLSELQLHGPAAILGNGLLLAQFPVLHTLLLSSRGRKFYRLLVPRKYLRQLAPTIYGILASLQVLLLFGLWTPMSEPFYEASGSVSVFFWVLYGASWLLLGKSMFDANLSLQTGALGWISLFRGKNPDYGNFPIDGLFKICRQPIYLAFAMITWTGPVWSWDRVVVATCLTAYCLIGPIFKEKRFVAIHGDAFRAYQKRVPYLPGLRIRA